MCATLQIVVGYARIDGCNDEHPPRCREAAPGSCPWRCPSCGCHGRLPRVRRTRAAAPAAGWPPGYAAGYAPQTSAGAAADASWRWAALAKLDRVDDSGESTQCRGRADGQHAVRSVVQLRATSRWIGNVYKVRSVAAGCTHIDVVCRQIPKGKAPLRPIYTLGFSCCSLNGQLVSPGSVLAFARNLSPQPAAQLRTAATMPPKASAAGLLSVARCVRHRRGVDLNCNQDVTRQCLAAGREGSGQEEIRLF